MPPAIDTYLDVETDWNRDLTVVGFRSSVTGFVQLVRPDITPRRLLRELPKGGRLFTYNGHCFDLSCIRLQLGLDLRRHFDSFDLRWICQRNVIRGGQKAIEHRIGVRRRTDHLDGYEAMRLWSQYQRGDHQALRTLLTYNEDDIRGLMAIKRYLISCGLLRGS